MSTDLAETIAMRFHETYERLAPEHGYKTREASAVPWADVPAANKNLMIAVVQSLLDGDVIQDPTGPIEALRAAYWKLRGHASGYRSTELFRRRQESWRTDPDNAVLARGAARDEWYARGIETAADDFAEILAVEYDATLTGLCRSDASADHDQRETP